VRKHLSVWLLALCLVAVGAGTAGAQQRSITGRVSNAVNDEPVVGGTVAVGNTAISAVTDAKGQFTLSAPDGPVTLVVRAIGYKRRTVTVGGDQSSLAIRLDQDIFNLEAVVVTGQATSVEQKNLANAVTTVTPEALNRSPSPTIESALQGKIPGALIQANSGAPGGGAQISLRGISTINASVDPLIVVDGLVISNVAIANGMNAVSAAAQGGNASNQDNAVNRIADLNIADIENVEVLKGASAAAIYGSAASNGVIIITTRHGKAGAPSFHMTQRIGQYRVSHLLGSRVFRDSVEADSVIGSGASAFCNLAGGACPVFNTESMLYGRHDLSNETQASVNGGNDNTVYFLSGLIHHDAGIAENTGYNKQSARANLGQRLGQRFNLNVNLNVVHSTARRGISNNDNSGTSPYLVFPFTYNFADLRPTGATIGDYPNNPFERSNPLQTFAFLKNVEDVWRAMGTGSLKFDALSSATQSLQLIFTGGLDYFSQRNDILSPPELEFEPQDGQPGTVVLGKASNQNLNLAGHAVHTYAPASGAYLATTSAGFQYGDRQLNVTNITGRNILTGQENIDQATSISIAQDEQPVKDLGLYAQEEVLALNRRLLLTAGLRADRSSRNGDPSQYFYYPKFAASYRITSVGGHEGDEVKLRGAWGQTGNQPNFGAKFTPDTTGTVGGRFGTYVGTRAGDATIRPERQTEIELGTDAVVLSGRLNLTFTFFNKTITDLLLLQTLPPSTGLTDRIFNGGKLRNRGIEASLGVSVLQRPDVSWIVRSTFFSYRPVIVKLPVPAFQVGGFGTALGAFQVEEGKSATQIVGNEGVVGDATPDFQMSFSTDFDYKRFSLGMLWDWKKGGDVINLTELLFDFGQNSADWKTRGAKRLADFLGGKTQPLVQNATYLKLRELSLAYHLPAAATQQLFGSRVSDARVSLSGRNLIRITKFRGLDPEVSNFGNQAIARNIDVAPFPPSRSFFLSVDLDF